MAEEPTNKDVMDKLAVVQQEIRVFGLETKVEIATLRNDVQEIRHTVQRMERRLDLFWDAFTDFRREYDSHTHPDAA